MIVIDIELLKQAYQDFNSKKAEYIKAYNYFKGDTDALRNYKMVTQRSNNKCRVNFVKKLVNEEVSYCFGNDITYISNSNNNKILNKINSTNKNINENITTDLAKYMLICGIAYEIAYVDRNGNFNLKTIKGHEGYYYNEGGVEFFLHIYNRKLDNKTYIDVYTKNAICHYDEEFKEIAPASVHIFSRVPISVAKLSEEEITDTIYWDIKGLQDSYETNLSDISNEISDFRNAYLKVINAQLDDEELPRMKELGIIQAESANNNVTIEWLIKNINDTFIQNTLNTVEDKIYQTSCHINHNEKLQSNLSGVTLRNRLISLENKCKLITKSLTNAIKSRLQLMIEYINLTENKAYDWKDIDIKFTPNIPSDDLMTAQIISQLNGLISEDTALSLLSFINNPATEKDKKSKEQENDVNTIGKQLLDNVGVADEQAEN